MPCCTRSGAAARRGRRPGAQLHQAAPREARRGRPEPDLDIQPARRRLPHGESARPMASPSCGCRTPALHTHRSRGADTAPLPSDPCGRFPGDGRGRPLSETPPLGIPAHARQLPAHLFADARIDGLPARIPSGRRSLPRTTSRLRDAHQARQEARTRSFRCALFRNGCRIGRYQYAQFTQNPYNGHAQGEMRFFATLGRAP